jgi:hypothetical protein
MKKMNKKKIKGLVMWVVVGVLGIGAVGGIVSAFTGNAGKVFENVTNYYEAGQDNSGTVSILGASNQTDSTSLTAGDYTSLPAMYLWDTTAGLEVRGPAYFDATTTMRTTTISYLTITSGITGFVTSTLQTLTVTSTAAVGGTLTVTGASSLNNNVTVTGTLGYRELVENATATDTIAIAESGKTFYISGATSTLTLPNVSTTGQIYRFVVSGAISTDVVITTAGSGNIIEGTLIVAGAVVDCDAEDTITFVGDGENLGDFFELRSNGSNWFIGASGALTGSKLTCTAT